MDITEFAKAIFTLAVSVLTCFIIPAIKQRMDANEFAEMCKWIDIAVDAAEMIYNRSGMGKEKKGYVVNFLSSRGYELDEDELDAAIEASVRRLKAGGKNGND